MALTDILLTSALSAAFTVVLIIIYLRLLSIYRTYLIKKKLFNFLEDLDDFQESSPKEDGRLH